MLGCHSSSCRPTALSACLITATMAVVSYGQVPTRTPSWSPHGVAYDLPFFANAAYDSLVKTPDEILGFKLGTRKNVKRAVVTLDEGDSIDLFGV